VQFLARSLGFLSSLNTKKYNSYKDKQGNVYAYEADGSQDHLIKSELIPIKVGEVESLVRAKQEADFAKEDYYRKRINSYPELGEFVDAWVKNDEKALEEYRAKCLEVKKKYPKPEGF
jgi:hypothetical protein